MRVINGCPCGEAHRLTDQNWRRFRDTEKRLGATVPFGNARACWRIPRIYLACHPVTAATVAGLAALYDWPEVK